METPNQVGGDAAAGMDDRVRRTCGRACGTGCGQRISIKETEADQGRDCQGQAVSAAVITWPNSSAHRYFQRPDDCYAGPPDACPLRLHLAEQRQFLNGVR
jgi:hypothetical protein